jgi:flagellar hook-associated protein 3 FlgL
MVNSISTFGQYSFLQNAIQTNQDQLTALQEQISSGQKAQTYGGLGGAATYTSLSLTTQANQLSAVNNAINAVTPITSAMDGAMTDITSAATTVASALQGVVQSGDPGMSVLGEQAQNALASIQGLLNTQSSGTYVFSGNETSTAPIADTTALNTAVQTDVAAFNAGTESASTFLANVSAYTATQNGYAANLATAGNNTVPTGANTSADYTVKADSSGFQSVMQGLAIIANLQYTPNNQSGFYQIYNAAIGMITSGTSGVTQSQATLGITTAAMTTAQTQISATQTVLNSALTTDQDMSQDDLTKASTTLTNLETQLQSSFSLISQLQTLHLVNYLNGSA